mgnify:CR=1 FL=1
MAKTPKCSAAAEQERFKDLVHSPFQIKMQKLADACIAFTARRGEAMTMRNDPFAFSRRFEFKSPQLIIRCLVTLSPYSNGYCSMLVRSGKKLVFNAESDYGAGPYRVKVKKYIPGSWEKQFFEFEKTEPRANT